MEETLIRILSETLHVEPELITGTSRLREDLGADSLDLFQVIYRLEELCGISLGDYLSSEKPETVQDIRLWLEQR